MIKFLKKHWLIVLILLAGAFLRFYKIDQYMIFLGDEARDMIVVRRFLVEFHPPLIGPGTSVGNMYLGPLYYYMMAIPTLIANFSPIGPALMIALMGIATIYLVWLVGKDWFNEKAGLIAAGLYSISPTVVIFSQSSWNPNIMPFFALLTIYSIWKVYIKKEYKWLLVTGVSYAFVLQSHYFGIFLLPVLILFWYLGNPKNYIRYTIYSVVLFALLMSPLLIFDLRHNFQNLNSILSFSNENGGSFDNPFHGFANLLPVFSKLNIRLLAGRNTMLGFISTIFILGMLVWQYFKKEKITGELVITLCWLIAGTFGLALYKGEVFDHYMGFIYPTVFILFGYLATKAEKIFISVFIVALILASLANSHLRYAPNNQLKRAQNIAGFINQQSGGQSMNLATLSKTLNRDVFQYFLLLWGARVVDTNQNEVKYTVTDQLYVVCDYPKEKCDPVHDPDAWITNFGWSKIANSWEVEGINIYKLTHTK